MTNDAKGRMLLSHNFALIESKVHPLNRIEFSEVFTQALSGTTGLACTAVDHPHWVVEVIYDEEKYTPTDVGQQCADALVAYRKTHQPTDFTIMALGGIKDTPVTSPKPSLQTGEWGVDIVETADPEEFLEEIKWNKLAGAKPAEAVFRIDCTV